MAKTADFKRDAILKQRQLEIDEMTEDGYVPINLFPNYMIHPQGMIWALPRYVAPGCGKCCKVGGWLAESSSATLYNDDGMTAIPLTRLLESTFGKREFTVSREFMEMVEKVADALLFDSSTAVTQEVLDKLKDTCVEVLDG